MTQLQVEELFDTSDKKERLLELTSIKSLDVTEEKLAELARTLKTEDYNLVIQIVLELIMIVGNPTNGKKIHKRQNSIIEWFEDETTYYTGVRAESFQSFIRSVLGIPALAEAFPNPQERYEMCFYISSVMDGVLYSVNLEDNVRTPKGFKTHQRVLYGFELPEDVIVKGIYEFYRMPLIEEPDKWTQDEKGGYLLNKNRVTKNKGYPQQPDSVLEVLNKLQAMAWTLERQCSPSEEYMSIYQENIQALLDDPELALFTDAKKMTDNSTKSLATTHSYMSEHKCFYYEWRYDFRGRIYPSAYDLNPQGGSYKKGAVHGCKA